MSFEIERDWWQALLRFDPLCWQLPTFIAFTVRYREELTR